MSSQLNQQLRSRRRAAPRGVIMLLALVVLGVVMAIGFALLKTAVLETTQVKSEQQRLQAQWLVESGIERAASKLSSDGEFQGETWRIGAEELGGRDGAEVLIRVTTPADRSRRRVIFVQADYPADTPLRARRSKELNIDLP